MSGSETPAERRGSRTPLPVGRLVEVEDRRDASWMVGDSEVWEAPVSGVWRREEPLGRERLVGDASA